MPIALSNVEMRHLLLTYFVENHTADENKHFVSIPYGPDDMRHIPPHRVRSWTHLYLWKRARTHGIFPTSSTQVQA